MNSDYDHYQRRCPRLGGPVSFLYCRTGGTDKQPCWKAFDCWWESFDIVTYMRTTLPEEQFEKLSDTRPQPKVNSIIELIAQAKRRDPVDN